MSLERWTCTDCGHEETSAVGEIAGEEYEVRVSPAGHRRSKTVTTVRCPECGNKDGWMSESTRSIVGTVDQSLQREG